MTKRKTRRADPDAALYAMIAEYEKLETALGMLSDREETILEAAKREAAADEVVPLGPPTFVKDWRDERLRRHGMAELEAERSRIDERQSAIRRRIVAYEPATLAGAAAKARASLLGYGTRLDGYSYRIEDDDPEYALAALARDLQRLAADTVPA